MEEKKDAREKEKMRADSAPASPETGKKGKLETESPREQIKLLAMLSKISLWVDDYDDIFSDFDPRPFSERAISGDFLYEAKKRAKENPSGAIELNLLVPANKRGQQAEETIKRRLRAYFKMQFSGLERESFNATKKGLFLIFSGTIIMFIATFVLLHIKASDLWSNFLVILLEPAGWFLFWEGLGTAFFRQKKEKDEMEFNKKMSKCRISFEEY